MLLNDFKALLWSYGGNLGSGSGKVDPEFACQPELFLLTASKFISSDARIATCTFNLVIEMAPRLSPFVLDKKIASSEYDARRLGVLISLVRKELDSRFGGIPKQWETIEERIRHELVSGYQLQPLISHLPSLPGRRDPLFLAWGFEYPGVVREPEKYLRRAI